MATLVKSISFATMRLRRLISQGYFPSELPPPFTTSKFSHSAPTFAAKWDGAGIRKYWTTPESYNLPRYGHARRKLSIINPVNQLHVAHLISENWTDIKARLSRSKITEFHPVIRPIGAGRAVNGVNFDSVARRKAEILALYGRYIQTDIARFYPSIYTHSIAWALLGKEHCKSVHQSKAFKFSFENLIDKAISAGQDGQTIGIPIGPDTSRIISELVATEIEEIARKFIPDLDKRAVRYVDDMIIGVSDNEAPSKILSALSQALYVYELEINNEKTSTRGFGIDHPPEWIHYVRNFTVSDKPGRQREDLDSFFEQAIFLSDANVRENVLLFACKKAASFVLDESNMAHFVRWMLYAARRSPSSLSFVAEHLAAVKASLPQLAAEINDYIIQQIPLKAEAGCTGEVAWLLFWAREAKTELPADVFNNIVNLRSSVIGLIVLELIQNNLILGSVDVSHWKSFLNADGLKSEMWLLAYEATKKGWWGGRQSEAFVTQNPYFNDIWNADVEFYNIRRHARQKVRPSIFASGSFPFGSSGSSTYPG